MWARPTTEQNLVACIDPKGLVTVNEDAVLKDVGKTYHVCPTYNGGRDWAQGAYNPKTNVLYFPLSNLCIESTARTDRAAAHNSSTTPTTSPNLRPPRDKVGRIDAISVETGRTLWTWETRVTNYSPAVGSFFDGSMDRYLRELDGDKGQLLWQARLLTQVVGGA